MRETDSKGERKRALCTQIGHLVMDDNGEYDGDDGPDVLLQIMNTINSTRLESQGASERIMERLLLMA